MGYIKTLYGKAIIKSTDFEERNEEHTIELEYFKIKKNIFSKSVGIQIIKKDINNYQKIIEEKVIRNHINNKNLNIDSILELFVKNSVSPINAEEIIEDLKYETKQLSI